MSIRRAPRKQQNFTIVDNSAFQSCLSFRAMGMLTYLLSKPDHWQVSVAQLSNYAKTTAKADGRDAIYSMIKELIEKGFVERSMTRDESGQVTGTDYVVYDIPRTDSPLPDKPYTDKPDTAEPTQVSTEGVVSTEAPASTENPLSSSAELNDAFERFWDAGLVKQGKAKSKPKFEKLCRDMKLTADQLADKLVADIKARKAAGQYGFDKLHALTYLNGRRWEDEVVASNVHKFPGKPQAKYHDLSASAEGLTPRADGTYSL